MIWDAFSPGSETVNSDLASCGTKISCQNSILHLVRDSKSLWNYTGETKCQSSKKIFLYLLLWCMRKVLYSMALQIISWTFTWVEIWWHWRPQCMIYITFMLIKPVWPTPPIRIEMFHHSSVVIITYISFLFLFCSTGRATGYRTYITSKVFLIKSCCIWNEEDLYGGSQGKRAAWQNKAKKENQKNKPKPKPNALPLLPAELITQNQKEEYNKAMWHHILTGHACLASVLVSKQESKKKEDVWKWVRTGSRLDASHPIQGKCPNMDMR